MIGGIRQEPPNGVPENICLVSATVWHRPEEDVSSLIAIFIGVSDQSLKVPACGDSQVG